MRLRILSRVDLPAPLRPMMPTTSPCLTSRFTSRSAQNSSEEGDRRLALEDGRWEMGDWELPLSLAPFELATFRSQRHGASAAS
jgi:hypothetical protein